MDWKRDRERVVAMMRQTGWEWGVTTDVSVSYIVLALLIFVQTEAELVSG
jgi:hypothetical protein